ncbi:MAG: hypothetical protein A2Y75_01655 [Candidatus Solincola sediminis]|uniref:Uncharacterized protein n=1 Tax=Candidatus Solincola sediminis TaxID=1797199 RepID=A0A1F2WNJ7_9ACTN|nr:MAG: hypothetical protein A2Y75_01655 [Candidatus Solincola sediminis]
MSWYNDWDDLKGSAKYALPVLGAAGGFAVGGPVGAAVGMGLGSAAGGMISGDEQKKAAESAASKQRDAVGLQIAHNKRSGREGSQLIGDAASRAANELRYGSRNAGRDLKYGENRQISALTGGYSDALSSYNSGMSGAENYLNTGATNALGEIDGGYSDSKLAQLWNPTFEADQGYNFRLGQGNDALAKAGAAAGGRISGAALKKASEYNQGFASNEYGNWFGRMSGIGSQLDAASQSRGLARANIQSGLGSNLAGLSERGGQYRSGLATSLAGNKSNIYGNTAVQQMGLNTGLSSNIANLYTGTASAQANSLSNVANSANNLTMASLPTYSASVPYSGAGWNAFSSGLGSAANSLAFGYGSGMLGGESTRSVDAYGYGDVGRNPNALAQYYGTSYTPAGYYQ